MTYGGKTAFEDTLDEALNKVFGAEGTTTEPPDEGGGTGHDHRRRPSDPTVQEALDDAQKAFDDGQAALKKGDWEAYGKAQADLEDALQRAEDAQADADKAGSGSSAGAAPSREWQSEPEQQSQQ